MTTEILLGFDWRVSPAEADSEWTALRRETYLYRLDCRRPLSIDRMVWPRAFRETEWDAVCDYASITNLIDDLTIAKRIGTNEFKDPDSPWLIAATVDQRNWTDAEWAQWSTRRSSCIACIESYDPGNLVFMTRAHKHTRARPAGCRCALANLERPPL